MNHQCTLSKEDLKKLEEEKRITFGTPKFKEFKEKTTKLRKLKFDKKGQAKLFS